MLCFTWCWHTASCECKSKLILEQCNPHLSPQCHAMFVPGAAQHRWSDGHRAVRSARSQPMFPSATPRVCLLPGSLNFAVMAPHTGDPHVWSVPVSTTKLSLTSSEANTRLRQSLLIFSQGNTGYKHPFIVLRWTFYCMKLEASHLNTHHCEPCPGFWGTSTSAKGKAMK